MATRIEMLVTTANRFSVPENKPKYGRRAVGGQKSCHVCGEAAKSCNYGGMSCHCCKSFFRHFVLQRLKPNSKISSCKYKGNCSIDKVSRKKCKTCRFYKCLQIGMDVRWVVSDHAKKTKKSDKKDDKLTRSCTPEPRAKSNSSQFGISDEDLMKIENLSNIYIKSCGAIPYNFPSRGRNEVLNNTKSRILIIGILSTAIRRFVYFARLISEFNNLSLIDQTNLLKNSVLQIILLRSAATYDIESNTVFPLNENYPENYPELRLDEIAHLFPSDLIEMHIQLYSRIKNIAPDESSIMLLIPLVIFSDSSGSEESDDRHKINSAQEVYAELLQKYLIAKYGMEKGRLIFPRLISQLAELCKVGQLHQGLPLNLTEAQVDKMHQHLWKLQNTTKLSQIKNEDASSSERGNQNSDTSPSTIPPSTNAATRSPPERKSYFDEGTPSPEEAESSSIFQLIRSFANINGETIIKPEYFSSGPHIGIEKAFMRRMPQLLMNPLDSLINNNWDADSTNM